MNFRERQLRKFYMSLTILSEDPFLYYTQSNGDEAILKYIGTKTSAKIPSTHEEEPVTLIECTAFYGDTNIQSVTINNNITKIL